jgi:hypothetical protein
MIVESEQEVYLYKEGQPGKKDESDPRKTNIAVTASAGGKPAMETSSTWGGPAGAVVKGDGSSGPVSRGYREEMEHFAWCMRAWGGSKVSYEKDASGKYKYADKLPRCHGEIAMADAILALTANMSMARKTRIEFSSTWFDAMSQEVPETKYGKPQTA